MIADHSQRLTSGRWEQAVDRSGRVNRLSLEDKLAIALHDFAAVTITIPMLIMYIFFNREIVAGMTSGSVKG